MARSVVQILGANGRPLRASDTAYYGASSQARDLKHWNPSIQSPDSELLAERGTLVARSRDLTRNNGVASGAVQTIVDNVIGGGLRLSARPDYRALGRTKEWADEWENTVEALWRGWADTTECDASRQMNFASLTALTFRTGMVSGEALALPMWRPRRPGAQYATCLQLVDPDRLSNPGHVLNAANMRDGIEIDEYGEPVAYHIQKTHPYDFLFALGASTEWERIPARMPWGRLRVIHVHDKERTGQSRGKPLATAVMAQFKMLDHYQRTELQAAVVNAMIAAFIESTASAEQLAELFGGSFDEYMTERGAWTAQLQGGAIIPTFPGDKLSAFTPSRPAAGYESFVMSVMRNIAAGLNIPYELLAKDFSQTNYSSARAALLEAWRFFTGRRLWMGAYWAQPVYELWLEEVVNLGLVDAPDFYAHRAAYSRARWIGPGRGWVDPVREVEAASRRIETGISTLEDECAEQGKDWEEVLEQRVRELTKIKELGLAPPEVMTPGFARELERNPDEPVQGQPGAA